MCSFSRTLCFWSRGLGWGGEFRAVLRAAFNCAAVWCFHAILGQSVHSTKPSEKHAFPAASLAANDQAAAPQISRAGGPAHHPSLWPLALGPPLLICRLAVMLIGTGSSVNCREAKRRSSGDSRPRATGGQPAPGLGGQRGEERAG